MIGEETLRAVLRISGGGKRTKVEFGNRVGILLYIYIYKRKKEITILPPSTPSVSDRQILSRGGDS